MIQKRKAERFVITKEANIELEEYNLPPLEDNEILVRNAYTAVSIGTEIYDYVHWMRNGKKVNTPIPSGYSSAGVVVEIGKDVTDIHPGDKVCGEGIHSSFCMLKQPYQKIPEGVSLQEAAMTVLAAVALHGIRKAAIQLGNSVVIFGVGIIGQLALSFTKLSGSFPIFAIDINDSKLQTAQRRGADYCLNSHENGAYADIIKKNTVHTGADIVIEATGLPSVYPAVLQLACTAGKIISLGSPRGSVEMDLLPEFHKKELSLIGAFQPLTPERDHVYYHWNKQSDRNLILQLLAYHRLNFLDLVTQIAAPKDCQAVYQMLADKNNNHLGVLFDWDLGE